MFKNMDYQDTYTTPEFANVRYPSTAAKSVNGWAYVLTKDEGYVFDLSQYHDVEVRSSDRWIPYSGNLPDTDELTGSDETLNTGDDDVDPNY